MSAVADYAAKMPGARVNVRPAPEFGETSVLW